jgi:hypothetical protein
MLHVKIPALCLLVLVRASSGGPPADTVPPWGKLVDPAEFSVITGNIIQFSARAGDGGSGVKAVRYYASFFTVIDSNESEITFKGDRPYRHVGTASEPPYNFLWDCSAIPDQDNWRMSFYCDVEDRAGNTASRAGGVRRHVVLDRNPAFSPRLWHARYANRGITVDGKLDDWPATDTLRFRNNNNDVMALSFWNKTRLCFGIFVNDAHLRGPPNDSVPYWWWDCVEIYMDLLRDRSAFRRLDDRQIDAGVRDTVNGNIVEFKIGVNRRWRQGVVCKVRASGTLDDNRDSDSGFVVEIAYAWSGLEHTPASGDSLGFDLFNDDNDFGQLVPVAGSWAGTERYNNNNPSEWGTLVLSGGPPVPLKVSVLWTGVLLLVFLLLKALIGRKKVKRDQAKKRAPFEQIADRLKRYVEENYRDPELNLSSAEKALKMSASHLRHSFKQALGVSFSDYLIRVRMDKARRVLRIFHPGVQKEQQRRHAPELPSKRLN